MGDLIAKGCDLIVLTPREEDPLRAATIKALAAGVPVIEIDRTSTGKAGVDYVCAIESNFVQQGEKVGNWMVANTHGTINYVELRGTTGASPAILRRQGFHNVIDKYSRFKLLDAQDGNFTLPDGKKMMKNLITRFGTKIDMIYAHNDDMGYGAFQAMQEAGFTKKVYIGSIDGTKRNIALVAAGHRLGRGAVRPALRAGHLQDDRHVFRRQEDPAQRHGAGPHLHQGQRGHAAQHGLLSIPPARQRVSRRPTG